MSKPAQILFLIYFLVCLPLAGCGGGGGGGSSGGGSSFPGGQLDSIALFPPSTTIFMGETQQIIATGYYSDYSSVDITDNVVWTSSNTNVATIDTSGLVTPNSPGSTTITAAYGKIQHSIVITVSALTTRLLAPRATGGLSGITTDGTNYVVVGDGISTSTDLLVWEERKAFGWFSDIEWNGNVYVALDNNLIFSSSDGKSWTLRASKKCYSVISSGTQFVAVGPSGTIVTSPDGMTWTSRTSNTTVTLNSVTWTGSQFVAVGASGTTVTSPDGQTWTVHNTGVVGSFQSVGSNGSQLVAGVYGTYLSPTSLYTSTDGINWTVAASGSGLYDSIIFAGSKWVAVGYYQSATSSDGINWTLSSSFSAILSEVIYTGTQYIAAGSSDGQGGAIYTSSDGLVWSLKTSYIRNNSIARSPVSGLLLVSGGYYGECLVSSDNGISWEYGKIGNYTYNIEWSPALSAFVAAVSLTTNQEIYSSTDGLSWTLLGNLPFSGKVRASPTLMINIGWTSLATSPDGVTWTTQTIPSALTLEDGHWTGAQFVVVGGSGAIITSPDGVTWSAQNSGTTKVLYSIASSPTQLVAVGQSGTIVTSNDSGVTWVTQQVSGLYATLNSVRWTGSKFIAVGNNGTIVESPDGVTWTLQDFPYSAMFGSDQFGIWDFASTGTSIVLVGDRGLVMTTQ